MKSFKQKILEKIKNSVFFGLFFLAVFLLYCASMENPALKKEGVSPKREFDFILESNKGKSVHDQEIVHRMNVLGNANWTDTGLDVVEGQEVYIRASGGLSLQKGNPMAYCDPDGYDYKGIQQPILNNNIGALIGKVVQLLSVEIDEETGEEIRNEVEEVFYIGAENRIIIPLSGSLFLGINEDVVGDNSGQFKVEIRLKNIGTDKSN